MPHIDECDANGRPVESMTLQGYDWGVAKAREKRTLMTIINTVFQASKGQDDMHLAPSRIMGKRALYDFHETTNATCPIVLNKNA